MPRFFHKSPPVIEAMEDPTSVPMLQQLLEANASMYYKAADYVKNYAQDKSNGELMFMGSIIAAVFLFVVVLPAYEALTTNKTKGAAPVQVLKSAPSSDTSATESLETIEESDEDDAAAQSNQANAQNRVVDALNFVDEDDDLVRAISLSTREETSEKRWDTDEEMEDADPEPVAELMPVVEEPVVEAPAAPAVTLAENTPTEPTPTTIVEEPATSTPATPEPSVSTPAPAAVLTPEAPTSAPRVTPEPARSSLVTQSSAPAITSSTSGLADSAINQSASFKTSKGRRLSAKLARFKSSRSESCDGSVVSTASMRSKRSLKRFMSRKKSSDVAIAEI